jgi:AcrR family transcriptional regulator
MSTVKKNVGRPRDETIRVRILQTAVTILIRQGYRATTMNEIALQARVGKQTLYRWWKNRAELLMETLLNYAEMNVDAADQDDGQTLLKSFLLRTFELVQRDSGMILKSLVAESITNKDFARVFFDTFIRKRQQMLTKILREHLTIRPEEPDRVAILVDVIFGTMWYRIIFGHGPLDEKLASDLADLVEAFAGKARFAGWPPE